MVEFGGNARRRKPVERQVHSGSLVQQGLISRLWTIRETGASATALNLGGKGADPVVGWEDAAVDPMRLGGYLREFQALVDRFGYHLALRSLWRRLHPRAHQLRAAHARGPHALAALPHRGGELVVKYGGSLSGEHGDGQAKGELLPIMFGPELMQAFREFKRAWDPQNRMNPGKLIDALPLDVNLRLGPEYKPVSVKTKFSFLSPVGDGFVRAAEHCIGMGKCRARGGTMCPSYRATHEERYSTRGRARLLAEMLRGEVITEGWASEEVRRKR